MAVEIATLGLGVQNVTAIADANAAALESMGVKGETAQRRLTLSSNPVSEAMRRQATDTITLRKPGTFPKLPHGPEIFDSEDADPTWLEEEVQPTRNHLEELADYVSAWDGVVFEQRPRGPALVFEGAPTGPETECSRSVSGGMKPTAPLARASAREAILAEQKNSLRRAARARPSLPYNGEKVAHFLLPLGERVILC